MNARGIGVSLLVVAGLVTACAVAYAEPASTPRNRSFSIPLGVSGQPISPSSVTTGTITTSFVDAGAVLALNYVAVGAVGTVGAPCSNCTGTGTGYVGSRVTTNGAYWCAAAPTTTNYAVGCGSSGNDTTVNTASGGTVTFAANNSTLVTLNSSGTLQMSAAGSGTNAIGVSTNGARIDFGAGATDYASSDGTTVTYAGPLASAGSITSNVSSNTFGFTCANNACKIAPGVGVATYMTESGNIWQVISNGSTALQADRATGAAAYSPTGLAVYSLSGLLSAITTPVASSGSASTLMSYTLPASALVVTNRCLRVSAWGHTTNSANAKTVSLAFGSQTIMSKALAVSLANGLWRIHAQICRTGSSTQQVFAEGWNDDATTVSGTDGATVLYAATQTSGTQTESSTIVIKGVATTATTTEITQDGMTVEFQ